MKVFGHSLSVIGIGLGIYTICTEKDNLDNSKFAQALEEAADSIEEKTKLIETLRDLCFQWKKKQPFSLTARQLKF